MTPTQIEALIERVKAATGPDRELDDDVLEAFGIGYYDYTRSYYEFQTDEPNKMDLSKEWHHCRPTKSIDAALVLVERVLPGWGFDLSMINGKARAGLWMPRTLGPCCHGFSEHGIPLTILTALLSALKDKS